MNIKFANKTFTISQGEVIGGLNIEGIEDMKKEGIKINVTGNIFYENEDYFIKSKRQDLIRKSKLITLITIYSVAITLSFIAMMLYTFF